MEQQNTCKCQLFSTCAWSNRLADQITVLPDTNPIRQKLSQEFQVQICNTANHYVWCCRNGEAATEAELKKFLLIEIFSGK